MAMRTVWRRALGAAAAVGVLAAAGAGRAAVIQASANGFELKQTVHIAAPAARVYAALIEPRRWWSPTHTFSGDAGNLTIDARAGGCFCEALPHGGTVSHLTVVMAAPGEGLTMRGAMGPFQDRGVDGAVAITLTPAGDGVDLTLTNDMGGYMSEGMAAWAPRADAMFAAQLVRLKRYLETGAPGGG